MSTRANDFLAKTLGEDFLESLQKVELWKPGTKTTLDHEEIKTALQIVPRVVMSYLIRELTPMQVGDTKEIHLPVGGSMGADAIMRVTKHERDVYSGEIEQENKKIGEFKYRSLPGIGLVILSAFELYNLDHLDQPQPEMKDDSEEKIQKLIEERLALHDLVNKVVDRKLMQKEAVSNLILMRLTEELEATKNKANVAQAVATTALVEVAKKESDSAPKKGSPLKDFLEARKNKSKKNEFSIQLSKGENVDCPDCGKNLFDGQVFAGCVCLGDDMEKRVFIKKTEDGIKVRFSRGWDQENIEMLLEVLRRKRG